MKGGHTMKRKLFRLILLTCFIVYSFSLTSIAKEPSSLTHKHDEEASSIIVTSGEEFILEVKANIDDADILTDVVIDTLSSGSTIKKTKNKSDISTNQIYCCEPGQATRDIRFSYHIRLSNGTCETYYRDAEQCTNCLAVSQLGPKQNISYHTTLSSCP